MELYDLLSYTFPTSGVRTNLLLPPLVAMVITFFTSMAGISGAFLLLPFQVSVLNYTAPSVSGTNHLFNVVAIPSGVYRFIREGRMAWPLTWVIVAGTLPGVFFGYWLRVRWLPDPASFKFFVGCVLLYIGIKLFKDLYGKPLAKSAASRTLEHKFSQLRRNEAGGAGIPEDAVVRTIRADWRRVEYEFWGERFGFNTWGMLLLAAVVGVIGGAYGIGGGSIIAPFCVAVFHLPVYTIAGAALMGTCITSVAGAFFFTIMPAVGGLSAAPDWPLGLLFGLGGCAGMYLGARCQKYVPQRGIKFLMGLVIISLAVRYILQFIL
ncbi:MAG: hypothetical protein BWK76_11225 [Desulfobulbaceae bacterium A2]|nr:MAG: hypothetical protein BWK76_11225 [Desulfobulbaceae bacterium A2]